LLCQDGLRLLAEFFLLASALLFLQPHLHRALPQGLLLLGQPLLLLGEFFSHLPPTLSSLLLLAGRARKVLLPLRADRS
jgi:hypothetical protein